MPAVMMRPRTRLILFLFTANNTRRLHKFLTYRTLSGQAKIHYLDIISSLPSYGAKCFSTNLRDGIERVLLVSPRFGLSQITGVRNSVVSTHISADTFVVPDGITKRSKQPTTICNIELLTRITITREDDVTHSVSAYVSADKFVTFSMEDREAVEFALVLAGYYRLLTGKFLSLKVSNVAYFVRLCIFGRRIIVPSLGRNR